MIQLQQEQRGTTDCFGGRRQWVAIRTLHGPGHSSATRHEMKYSSNPISPLGSSRGARRVRTPSQAVVAHLLLAACAGPTVPVSADPEPPIQIATCPVYPNWPPSNHQVIGRISSHPTAPQAGLNCRVTRACALRLSPNRFRLNVEFQTLPAALDVYTLMPKSGHIGIINSVTGTVEFGTSTVDAVHRFAPNWSDILQLYSELIVVGGEVARLPSELHLQVHFWTYPNSQKEGLTFATPSQLIRHSASQASSLCSARATLSWPSDLRASPE